MTTKHHRCRWWPCRNTHTIWEGSLDMHCWSTGTTSILRWVLDPRSHSLDKCLEEHWFSSDRSITYQTLRLWPATNQRYGRVHCERHMWFNSATTPPRCRKQRCFVAWPELDSSVPIRHQRTTLYATGVSGATFRRCAHSGCANRPWSEEGDRGSSQHLRTRSGTLYEGTSTATWQRTTQVLESEAGAFLSHTRGWKRTSKVEGFEPMGSSACQFRRPISGKHVAAGNGRTFQVAERHSTCELPNDRDNHCRLFTIWGLPKTLVSDNGPQFASADFAYWCRSNCIVHMTSAPFHPSSNGEAERLVGVFKRAMQRSVVEEGLEKD